MSGAWGLKYLSSKSLKHGFSFQIAQPQDEGREVAEAGGIVPEGEGGLDYEVL